jgi:signal transduction histidine kinase
MSSEQPETSRRPATRHLRLRTQLFTASALLSSAILLIAAWVINTQVVDSARRQVQAEVETLLPLYQSIWQEYGRSLATLGQTMSGSPVVKTIIGDPRASLDRATLREMINDFAQGSKLSADFFLISDGAGQVRFAEVRGVPLEISSLDIAVSVAEAQTQYLGFLTIGGRLFQLALTPVLLHSGSADYQNTLAVIGTGSELNREMAHEIERRIHCDVLFLTDDRLYASSLPEALEAQATAVGLSNEVRRSTPDRPVEVTLESGPHLAFSTDLVSSGKTVVGHAVILRSLAGAGRLFHAISNRLLLLWTLSIVAALVLSYFIASGITRSIDALVEGVEEFGKGNDRVEIPTTAYGEIGRLARSFDAMRGSLKRTQTALLRSERLATIGQMASSIVHDLRNPLAAITTAAEVLNRDGLDRERQRVLLESQVRAAERMNLMLSELLEFSQGSYRLELRRSSLFGIVERAFADIEPQAKRARATLNLDLAADIEVSADSERLRRVLENLLLNAIQANARNITIRARVETSDVQKVRVEIVDDGNGVPAEIRDRIFEPFSSHGKRGGTGLGLAIAQRIVEGHGGEIGLDASASSSDRGSRFFVILPLAVQDPP